MNTHLADALIDARIGRQGRDFSLGQLRHAELALLRRLLRPDERDLLLGHDGLRLNLADELQEKRGQQNPLIS